MLLSLHLALQALGFADTPDGELVDMYMATRNERYFGELYRRYSPKVFGKCLTMLGNDAEAHDAVQDVFERVLTRIGGFRQDAQFGTWLFSITNNHCIDRLRRRKRRRVVTTEISDEHLPDEGGDDADDNWLEEQSPEAIRYILERLSELDRAALVLMYMDDMSVREIAAHLDLQESATKMRLKRARDRARKHYLAWPGRQAYLV